MTDHPDAHLQYEREAALAAAAQIPGWMSGDELGWLVEQAQQHDVIVEVGSYAGRSAKALAMSTTGVVYSVDNLAGEPIPTEALHMTATSGKDLDSVFRANCAEEIASGKIRVIRKPSLVVARRSDLKPDMVFIDGDHTAENVVIEVKAWRKRVVPGGLLCGHDAGDARVDLALAELGIAGRGPGRIWFEP